MNMEIRQPNPSWTIEQLCRHFGGIPAKRIYLDPAPGTATTAHLLKVKERRNRTCELLDGVLVEKAMGWIEALLAGDILVAIKLYLREHDLGEALPPDGFLKLCPGIVRAADVSFIAWERIPVEKDLPPIPHLAPDLAVEVISRGNTKQEMERKLHEYFTNGTRLVWLVYPKKRIVEVYTSPTELKRLTARQTLDGGDVLPGFQLALAELFAPRGRKGR